MLSPRSCFLPLSRRLVSQARLPPPRGDVSAGNANSHPCTMPLQGGCMWHLPLMEKGRTSAFFFSTFQLYLFLVYYLLIPH